MRIKRSGLPLAVAEGACARFGGEPLGPSWGIFVFLAIIAAIPGPLGAAAAQTTTKSMPYEECLASKAEMQAQLAVQADRVFDIVNTSVVTITRFCTDGGSVLIGCSKPTAEMVISVRPSQSAVGCLWRSLVKTPT